MGTEAGVMKLSERIRNTLGRGHQYYETVQAFVNEVAQLEAENERLREAWRSFKYAESQSVGSMLHPDYQDAFDLLDTLLEGKDE